MGHYQRSVESVWSSYSFWFPENTFPQNFEMKAHSLNLWKALHEEYFGRSRMWERDNSVKDAWGYHGYRCILNRGEMPARQSMKTLKLNDFKESTHWKKNRCVMLEVLHWIDELWVVPTFGGRQTSEWNTRALRVLCRTSWGLEN